MPLPPAFKTDESFIEKLAMGAAATRATMEDLARHGHQPIELERGSTSFKVWKEVKIKRIRVPDIVCLRCGRRIESRGKSRLEITMSHSTANPERGWDAGMDDGDVVALVACEKSGLKPWEWRAREPIQYISVDRLRAAFRAGHIKTHRAKGAQEGFEVRITWPAAITDFSGTVVAADGKGMVFNTDQGDRKMFRLNRRGLELVASVGLGDSVHPFRIVASVVPVTTSLPCAGGATVGTYIQLVRSPSLADRYTATKALGHFDTHDAEVELQGRLADDREHLYVRVESAAALLRRGHAAAGTFFETLLLDDYLERRMEAAIVLSEVPTMESARILLGALSSRDQEPAIRAGAAWSLGVVGGRNALPALIATFHELEPAVKIEAARALSVLARRHLPETIAAFAAGDVDERPAIAWALGKAGGFTLQDLLPTLVDDDARHWITYVVGTQEKALIEGIEDLAGRDPEVYFGVVVLWKILSSWVYDLEEY